MSFQGSIVIITSLIPRTKPFSWVDLQEFAYEVCSFRILLKNVLRDVNIAIFDILFDISFVLICLKWKFFG